MSFTYQASHLRACSLWGQAAAHPCVTCRRPAQQWAYDGSDPAEWVSPAGFAYSIWPEFYMPLCRSCHKRHDLSRLGRPIKPYDRGRPDRLPTPRTLAEWEHWKRERSA